MLCFVGVYVCSEGILEGLAVSTSPEQGQVLGMAASWKYITGLISNTALQLLLKYITGLTRNTAV